MAFGLFRKRVPDATTPAVESKNPAAVPARAFETNRTPWGLLELMNVGAILAFGHEVMVNNCLIFRHTGTT